jgi:hypothetical protein
MHVFPLSLICSNVRLSFHLFTHLPHVEDLHTTMQTEPDPFVTAKGLRGKWG